MLTLDGFLLLTRQSQLNDVQQAVAASDKEILSRNERAASLQAAIHAEAERSAAFETAARALDAELAALQHAAVDHDAAAERVESLRRAVAAETRVTSDLMRELSKLRSACSGSLATP